MKPEAIQKCSSLCLRLLLAATFVTLVITASTLALIYVGLLPPSAGTLLLPAIALAALGAFVSLRHGYEVSDSALEIIHPFGRRRILNSSICRVDRIRRSSAEHRNSVRISYQAAGLVRRVELHPADPADFLASLLPHCPQLSGSRQWKLARDPSFRAAREALAPRRRRTIEEPW